MTRNDFRAATIGVTAGVVAGVVTIAGAIAYDEFDLRGQAERALARRRLSPAERAELERLEAAKQAKDSAKELDRTTRTAEIRSKFQPTFIEGKRAVASLEELTVPQLVTAIERGEHTLQTYRNDPWGPNVELIARWSEHMTALLDEFHRRRGWQVHRQLSLPDQLRMELAEARMNTAKFQPTFLPWQATTSAPAPAPASVEGTTTEKEN
ncbi:hypothetical protein [Nocardia asiatica]